LERLGRCIDRGLEEGQDTRTHLRVHVEKIRQIAHTLDPTTGSTDQREASFLSLQQTWEKDEDPIRQHMAQTMQSFHPGLFVGEDDPHWPRDNLDLERFFRTPKGHERRIHGHAHAGVRIVQEGPTLIPTLDAHLRHPTPFTHRELRPYIKAKEPACQKEAIHRRTIMRKARSKKNLPRLLKELEQRYANSS
jgi:hypothetical protein